MSISEMGKFFIMYPSPTYKKIQILSTDFNFLYLSPSAPLGRVSPHPTQNSVKYPWSLTLNLDTMGD